MSAISKPLLPPKKGYVEVEVLVSNEDGSITKERKYKKVDTYYSTETLIIKESQVFTVPEAKGQRFQVELIGAGGAYKNSINGSDGETIIRELVVNKGETIDISIGVVGVNNSNGGTTSFGNYFCAIGGASGQEGSSETIIHNENYGKGGTIDTKPTNGVCIITYQAPLSN